MKKTLSLVLSALLALTFVMAVAPNQELVDLSSSDNGCYSENGAVISDWGVATTGYYGGFDKSEFCLVWDLACEDNNYATAELNFPTGTDVLEIRHLDGMSDLDSFEVYIDNVLVGTYLDSQDGTENWLTSTFDVSVTPGLHDVKIKITGEAWEACDLYGQLAIDYIKVTPQSSDVPEFGIIGAGIVLLGAGLFVFKKRN